MTADERPDPAATTGDGFRVTVAPGFDVDYYLDQVGAPIPGQEIPWGLPQPLARTTARLVAPSTAPARHAGQAELSDGHVDPAAAARWKQAQTEMVGLIREENRTIGQVPEAERSALLPDHLGDWMSTRAVELEQAEAGEPEIEPFG